MLFNKESKIQNYINEIAEEEMDSYKAKPLIDQALSFLPEDISTVLSIGCGSGYELEALTLKGKEVTAIDFNKKQVDKLKGTYNVKHMDMHDLQFDDNSFECVIFRDVFEHATAPLIAMKESSRVSKKYVYVILPDETWDTSPNHVLIPTLRQMIQFGYKSRLALVSFTDMYVQLGEAIFKQSYYFFLKLK